MDGSAWSQLSQYYLLDVVRFPSSCTCAARAQPLPPGGGRFSLLGSSITYHGGGGYLSWGWGGPWVTPSASSCPLSSPPALSPQATSLTGPLWSPGGHTGPAPPAGPWSLRAGLGKPGSGWLLWAVSLTRLLPRCPLSSGCLCSVHLLYLSLASLGYLLVLTQSGCHTL